MSFTKETAMEHNFWHQAWKEGRTGFNQSEPNQDLTEFFPKLPENSHVMVPLCGKSIDLMWLSQQNYKVTGVEINRGAVESFFKENALNFQSPSQNQYLSQNIELIVGDYLEHQKPGFYDAIYDRAALVALPPEMRREYAKHSLSLLKDGGFILLVTFEYDQEKVAGPPFCVLEEEVRDIYGGAREIILLREASLKPKNTKFSEANIKTLKRKVFKLV